MIQKNSLPTIPFRSVLIYGMGMMGTSLAWSLRQASSFIHIAGVVSSQKSADYLNSLQYMPPKNSHNISTQNESPYQKKIIEKKIIDKIFIHSHIEDAHDIVYKNYELIIFGIAIEKIITSLPHLSATISTYSTKPIITDMSSTQTALCLALKNYPDLCYIHSHPLCGSEKSGPNAIVKELFQERLCLLSRLPHQKKECQLIEQLWQSIGMYTHITETEEHDQALAYLSHVPHFLSSLLCLWVINSKPFPKLQKKSPIALAGGGLQDMTRIAASNPKMWIDILKTNQENILFALEKYQKELSLLIQDIKINGQKSSHWLSWFQKAQKAKDILYGRSLAKK